MKVVKLVLGLIVFSLGVWGLYLLAMANEVVGFVLAITAILPAAYVLIYASSKGRWVLVEYGTHDEWVYQGGLFAKITVIENEKDCQLWGYVEYEQMFVEMGIDPSELEEELAIMQFKIESVVQKRTKSK